MRRWPSQKSTGLGTVLSIIQIKFTSSDVNIYYRVRELYNSKRLQFSTIQEKCSRGKDIDQMFSKVQEKFGNINLIVNSEKCRYEEFSSHLESLGKIQIVVIIYIL